MRIFAFADEASPFIDGQITAMRRNGIAGLEIRNVDNVNISDITLDKAKEVKNKLDAAGLITWSIGSPIGKIGIKDDFTAHLEKFKRTVDIAAVLGAENIRLFSFFMPEGEEPDCYKNEVIEKLGIFVETAKGTGIELCHENEKGIYGDIALRCLEIYRALPGIKGIFDPANFIQCSQPTLEAWKMLHPYIKYMHIKDALHDGSVVPAGKGDGELPVLLKNFTAIGGKELTVEPHLAVFEGLADLEQDGNTSHIGKFVYGSNDEAFDAACTALKEILNA